MCISFSHLICLANRVVASARTSLRVRCLWVASVASYVPGCPAVLGEWHPVVLFFPVCSRRFVRSRQRACVAGSRRLGFFPYCLPAYLPTPLLTTSRVARKGLVLWMWHGVCDWVHIES